MTEQEMNSSKANAMVEQYGPAPTLDLSKIKNMEASTSKNVVSESVVKKAEEKARKEKKAKFCFTEEHEVALPSKGILYQDCDDEDIKNGIVRLRPMSLADEEIIANQAYIKNGTVFTNLLNSCMVNNFDARNFISYDVYYLIYALRQITYGETYDFDLTCPECESVYKYSLDMSEVEFSEVEKDETLYKKFKLPVSKYTVEMRCSTLGDEEQINRLSKKFGNEYSKIVLSYVCRTLGILNEKGEAINPNDFQDFFIALPAKDVKTINDKFSSIEDMKIPRVTCTCPKCGYSEEQTIPFTPEFFRG